MIQEAKKAITSALHHIYSMRQAEILIGDATADEVDRFIADTAQTELLKSENMDMESIAIDAMREVLDHIAEEKPSTAQ